MQPIDLGCSSDEDRKQENGRRQLDTQQGFYSSQTITLQAEHQQKVQHQSFQPKAIYYLTKTKIKQNTPKPALRVAYSTVTAHNKKNSRCKCTI